MEKMEKSKIIIVIICYNNYKYVEYTVQQITQRTSMVDILIMDNASTCPDTIAFLKTFQEQEEGKVIFNKQNMGPWLREDNNKEVYNQLPEKFFMTDPDLEWNPNLPSDFIEILSNLSETYQSEKIGFALDISDFHEMFQALYCNNKNIYEHEQNFWVNKIPHEKYELYKAPIDTTFCLVNKKYKDNHIRIAGNFTAKHLPWYVKNKVYNHYQNYILNLKTTHISTISKIVVPFIQNNFLILPKKKEVFLIKKTQQDKNINFWRNHFSSWENETFDIFDTYLRKDKIFIDIGGWIGTTAMYGSRKSQHVYCVEADLFAFQDLTRNMKNNCEANYTLINKAIYHQDKLKIKFGKNQFLENATMNDSTSQINENASDAILVDSITFSSIITEYKIPPSNISLVKVDIEGGEETILNELHEFHTKYHIPLYVSFHYSWWKDKNLYRFSFLTENQIQSIYTNPFISLLFV